MSGEARWERVTPVAPVGPPPGTRWVPVGSIQGPPGSGGGGGDPPVVHVQDEPDFTWLIQMTTPITHPPQVAAWVDDAEVIADVHLDRTNHVVQLTWPTPTAGVAVVRP